MENNKSTYVHQLLKNQEQRTQAMIDLETYFNKMIQVMESEWRQSKHFHHWDYKEKCQGFMNTAQNLNKELRELQGNNNEVFNLIENLLVLEENNYKNTINLFLCRLKNLELLKQDADESSFALNEKEIDSIKIKLAGIREQLNDLITNLKYQV